MNNNSFVAYEYKSITVKRDAVTFCTDCLSNFGWVQVEEHEQGFQPTATIAVPYAPVPDLTDENDRVSLKFKRNRRIGSEPELNKLESQCEEALASIRKLERRSHAYTMGISLGTGLIGTALLGIAVYGFISSNIVLGVIFSALGIAGWGVGFFSNLKARRKKAIKTEPLIQEQLDIAYSACEQAHAFLA